MGEDDGAEIHTPSLVATSAPLRSEPQGSKTLRRAVVAVAAFRTAPCTFPHYRFSSWRYEPLDSDRDLWHKLTRGDTRGWGLIPPRISPEVQATAKTSPASGSPGCANIRCGAAGRAGHPPLSCHGLP